MSEKTPALPDRAVLTTEQRLIKSAQLDTLSVAQTLQLMNEQDAHVTAAVQSALGDLALLVTDVAAALQNGGRLIYVGAGTSGRLGVLDASECPPTFHTDPAQVVGMIAGGDTALRKSSEGAEDDADGAHAQLKKLSLHQNDVVVGIAASGTTPFVHGALQFAHRLGARTALICCVHLSCKPDYLHHLIELLVGPEVLTGSTRLKAGTATKMALNMITTGAMVQLGKTWGNLMVDLSASNIKLRDRAARIIADQCDLPLEAALSCLDRADGRVKVALVMARKNVDAAQALEMLAAHNGHLRPLLGAPK